MITTSEVAPSPALAPFVRCYSLRVFDTNGLDLVRPWHASHEVSISFHLKTKPHEFINLHTGQILKGGNYGGVMGIGTQYNGEMTFDGFFSMFEIILKPNGFHKIFRFPPNDITNNLVFADNIFDFKVKLFFEQLCMANGLSEMATSADAYLLYYLKKQKSVYYEDAITSSSNIILKRKGIINVDRLAYNANMSIRNFRRHFIKQIGVSPKLFCSITRFNNALNLKLKDPKKHWTSIVYECGYFDQMHLIRDFRRFSGNVPSDFLKQTPLTKETYTNRVEI